MKGRKRLKSIIIILLIVLQIILTINSYAIDLVLTEKQENIKIVDKNGKGDYTVIQEAIDKEPDGTTIYIRSGIYKEILIIKKKINLIGENKDNTMIHSESEQNKYSIWLNAPSIFIENLSIRNSGQGLYCSGIKITASKTKIKNCYIYNTPVGIAIFSSNNIIENCKFYECSDEGLALLGSPYLKCKNNKIINCKFYGNCDGIELQYSTDNIITHCEFFNNTHSAIDAIISSNDRNIISDCKIYNNCVHGIYLSSSSYNKIINCDILNNHNGNIIMNKDSKNNEIISSLNKGYDDKKENHLKETIYFLLSNRFNIQVRKTISIIKEKILTYF